MVGVLNQGGGAAVEAVITAIGGGDGVRGIGRQGGEGGAGSAGYLGRSGQRNRRAEVLAVDLKLHRARGCYSHHAAGTYLVLEGDSLPENRGVARGTDSRGSIFLIDVEGA